MRDVTELVRSARPEQCQIVTHDLGPGRRSGHAPEMGQPHAIPWMRVRAANTHKTCNQRGIEIGQAKGDVVRDLLICVGERSAPVQQTVVGNDPTDEA